MEGLEERMRRLMTSFREERPEIIGEDRTDFAIRALLRLADIKETSDVSDIRSGEVAVSALDVVYSRRRRAIRKQTTGCNGLQHAVWAGYSVGFD